MAGSVATTVSGAQMTLNQASRAAIMNWQQFNIAPNEAVRILQSGAGAAMLARVTGGNPSELLGRLQADGKLFLINPNGILVGAGAVIDTGSFLASTLDVADADFLKGGALVFKGDTSAGIVNLGKITAREGNVLLFAHAVQNAGEIAVPKGTAGLGAGTEVFLASPDDTSFTVKLNLPATAEKTGVENTGMIAAAQAELKAAGGSIYDLAVNQSGLVRASGVEQRPDGRVILTADGGTVGVTGSVAAQNADGSGGEILVGGDFQGKNPVVANATRTYVGPAATLDASATAPAGDGGKVVVWADGATSFSGAIAAQGGSQGGNGGNAEVSGKGSLSFNGTADLRAPNGVRGTLLLDPLDITINAGAAGANPAGLVTVGVDSTWPFNADVFAQSITNGTVNALLDTGNLELQATNSLTVGAAVSSNAANSLTLNAPIIAVNAGISLPNGTLRFMSSNSAAVSLDSAASAPITAKQVQITGNFAPVTLAGAVTTQTLLFDTITGTSLSVANAANSIAQVQFMPGSISLSGDVVVASSSAMSVFGEATTTAGAITLTSGGNLTMQAGTTLTAGGLTTLASTGGAFINQAGSGLLAGSGRKLIYTATTGSGFTDGGLGYTQVNSVAYPADPQGAGNVTYVKAAYVPPTLTITADDFTKRYGEPDPAFTASYSGGTSANLTTLPSFSILQGAHTNVGSYTIVPSGAASNGYSLAYVNGTLTIDPAILTVTANPASRLYGAANPAFTAQYSGFVNGDTAAIVSGLQWATSATAATPVGNYPIIPAAATAPNYTIRYVAGLLSVTPAPLTITAPDASRYYGDPNVFSSAVQYSGLVNGDTVASLYLPTPGSPSPQVQLASPATATSPVGTYPIIPSGFNLKPGSNYSIVYAPGTLSVTRIPYTIAAPDLTTLVGAVPASVAVTTPALPSFGPQFTVYATPVVNGYTGGFWSGAPLPTYALLPSIVPAANTTLGDISAYYDIQLVPGSIKTTRPPVDPVTLKQGTITVPPVVFDTQPDTTVTILDNSTTKPLLNEEELKANMEVKDSKVVVKFGTMDKYTLNTVVNELGADLLPYVKEVLGNADSMKDMPEAQRKILEDYRDGKITAAQLATMMSRDSNALAAMMPALGKAMMDAIASGKPLSDAQQTFAAHIAENVNKQRVMLANEIAKQTLEYELAKAEVGHNNPWSLKTLPDIALSAQQAVAEQAIGAAVGAGVGLGLGVGVAAVLNVSAIAGAIFPYGTLPVMAINVSGDVFMAVPGGAATGLGAGAAAGLIGTAVGVVVVGVTAAVMVAQEQKNIDAYNAAMARAKTPVDAKLAGLDLKNSDTSKTEFFTAFLATMLQIN